MTNTDETWWKGLDSGLGDDDEAVPSKLDKDFTAEPPSVIGIIAFSLFTVPGAIIFGGVGVWLLFFSIMNPYHEDGDQRTPARAAQQGSTGLPGYVARARGPSA